MKVIRMSVSFSSNGLNIRWSFLQHATTQHRALDAALLSRLKTIPMVCGDGTLLDVYYSNPQVAEQRMRDPDSASVYNIVHAYNKD